jgi:hypothetical protein
MVNNQKLYYYSSNLISLCMITFSIINIKSVMDGYNTVKKDNENNLKQCKSYFIWKLSIFLNIFFFFCWSGFTTYLLYKRRQSYFKIIYVRIGPMVDTSIVMLLSIIGILFGPFLILQMVLIILNANQIIYECKFDINDPVKNYFIPYLIGAFILSILMCFLLGILINRKCSRRNIMRRRNIANISELINII